MRQPLTDESLKRVCSDKDFVCKKVDSVRRFSYFQSGYVVATMASIFGLGPSDAKGKNAACRSLFAAIHSDGCLASGQCFLLPYTRARHTHIVNTLKAPLRAHRLMYGGVRPNLLLRPPPTIEF
jgi:hypothetical protein